MPGVVIVLTYPIEMMVLDPAVSDFIDKMGVATKLARPGDRRDEDPVTDGVWTERVLTQLAATVRWKVSVADLLTAVPTLVGPARDRLPDMADFFTFLPDLFAHLGREFDLWKKEQKGVTVPREPSGY